MKWNQEKNRKIRDKGKRREDWGRVKERCRKRKIEGERITRKRKRNIEKNKMEELIQIISKIKWKVGNPPRSDIC